MEKDQPIRERGQRKASPRRDENGNGDEDRRDLEDPRVAVLRADARECQKGRAEDQEDERFPAGRTGRGSRFEWGPTRDQLLQSTPIRMRFVAFQVSALTFIETPHG